MSDSSILSSESPPIPSSDSLDTTIGLATETGRATAVASSSSSENLPLSDPTLTSDSSRPITPQPQGGGQDQNGDSYRVPRAAPSGGHREHTDAAAAAGSRPAAVHSPERAATAAGEAPSLPYLQLAGQWLTAILRGQRPPKPRPGNQARHQTYFKYCGKCNGSIFNSSSITSSNSS